MVGFAALRLSGLNAEAKSHGPAIGRRAECLRRGKAGFESVVASMKLAEPEAETRDGGKHFITTRSVNNVLKSKHAAHDGDVGAELAHLALEFGEEHGVEAGWMVEGGWWMVRKPRQQRAGL